MADVERIGGRMVLLDKGKVRLDRALDGLREEVCMAMAPRASAPDAATIEKMRGCLGVRLVLDEWHAAFQWAAPSSWRPWIGKCALSPG